LFELVETASRFISMYSRMEACWIRMHNISFMRKMTAALGHVRLWNFRPGWLNYIFVSDMKILLDDNNFYLDFNKFNSYCSILYRLF